MMRRTACRALAELEPLQLAPVAKLLGRGLADEDPLARWACCKASELSLSVFFLFEALFFCCFECHGLPA